MTDDPATSPDAPPTVPLAEVPPVRKVADAATLKALSDPLRLALLGAMSATTDDGVRTWTAKELAAELQQPQTKLYRHLRTLEEAELVRVSGTRMVSGILEQRYVIGQRELEFAPGTAGSDAAGELLSATFDHFRRDLLDAVRAGRVDLDATPPPGQDHLRPYLAYGKGRIPAARASELRARLRALIDEYLTESDTSPHDDPTTAHLLISLYTDET